MSIGDVSSSSSITISLRGDSAWSGQPSTLLNYVGADSVIAMLVDEFLGYEIADAVATDVDADRATTFAALLEVDLVEVGQQAVDGFLGCSAGVAGDRGPANAR